MSVCLFVCLFVYDYSRTTGYEAAYERYQQLQCYKGKKNNVAISLRNDCVREIWRENKLESQYCIPRKYNVPLIITSLTSALNSLKFVVVNVLRYAHAHVKHVQSFEKSLS